MLFVSPLDFWDVRAVRALCLYSAEMDLEHLRAKKVWRVKGPCSLFAAHCWCGECALGCSQVEEQDCWYLQ